MKHLVVFTAFDRTTSDGLSFDLSSTLERQPTNGVVPDYLNWLNTYTQVGGPYGYTYQRVTGTSQSINLKLSTTLAGMQRFVASDTIDLLAGNATWIATASGTTFSVPINSYVAFRLVASKLGVTGVSVLNASDNDTVLDTFTATVANETPTAEYQPEFVSYGTGWAWMAAGTTTSQIYQSSMGGNQLIGSYTFDDPGADDIANTQPIFFGTPNPPPTLDTGKIWNNYTYDNAKPMISLRPSSAFGSNNRAAAFIAQFPNSYLKVYYGPPNVYGNNYRVFTNPRILGGENNIPQVNYVMWTSSTGFSVNPLSTSQAFRIELYTS
jgi:hypothetical protein